MNIAMWSGPRNLSTAMMYSFAARSDFAVSDEPFYSAFLAISGIDHPMRQQVLDGQEQDPLVVADHLAGAPPNDRTHWYQKHMCHHMINGVPIDWAQDLTNVFLIRHPARVIASYLQKRESPTLEDIGFERQVKLYEQLGGAVIDSFDIRQNPEKALNILCEAIGVPFDPSMLAWKKGGISEDGVWASHWYNAVHQSTGFAGPEGPLPEIDHPLLAEAMEYYDALRSKKLFL